jgi:mono/diheme cytochrome c family protein
MHLPDFSSLAARHRRARNAVVATLAGVALGLALAGTLSAHDEESTSAGAKPADKTAPPAKGDGWEAPGEAKKVPNPVAADQESIARGQAVYAKACMSCHGAEGKGDGKSAKILAKKPADLNLHAPHHSDGDLFWKITEGKKPMPSFKKDLKENQRWDVVNYLRKLTGPAEAHGDSAKKAEKAADKAEKAKQQEPPPVIPEGTNQSPNEGGSGY